MRTVYYFAITGNGAWPFLILVVQGNVLISPEHFFLPMCECHCWFNIILDPSILREAFGVGWSGRMGEHRHLPLAWKELTETQL